MTPEEFKAKFRGRLIGRYLAEQNKVSMVAAYQALTSQEKVGIQRIFEQENIARAGRLLQNARKQLAGTLADTRLDEITADGNISLDSELDEFLL